MPSGQIYVCSYQLFGLKTATVICNITEQLNNQLRYRQQTWHAAPLPLQPSLGHGKIRHCQSIVSNSIQRGILEEVNHYLRSSLVPALPDPRNVNTGPQEIQGCSWVKPARRQKKTDLPLETTQPSGSTQTHGSVSKHPERCEERNICKCKNRIH